MVLLLFLAYTLGAAMRPGVDSLVRVGIPRALALVGHFALFFAVIALLLWLIVPVAFDQTQQALADVPQASRSHRSGSPALDPGPSAERARIEARGDLGAEHCPIDTRRHAFGARWSRVHPRGRRLLGH